MIDCVKASVTLFFLSVVHCQEWKWFDFKDYYFKPEAETVLYSQAKQFCKDLGGSLVTLKKQEVYDFVRTQLIPNNLSDISGPPYHFWIGLEMIENGSTSGYFWPDGTPLDKGFQNWLNNSPSSIPNALHVRMGYTGSYSPDYLSWNNTFSEDSNNTDHLSRYICDRNYKRTWISRRDKQYYFRLKEHPVTQERAQEFCNSEGGTLVMFKADENRDFILQNVLPPNEEAYGKTSSYAFWIGLIRNNNTNNSFSWIDGTPLENTTSRWAPGYPMTNNSEANYVVMGWFKEFDPNYRWRNIAIETLQEASNGSLDVRFICERTVTNIGLQAVDKGNIAVNLTIMGLVLFLVIVLGSVPVVYVVRMHNLREHETMFVKTSEVGSPKPEGKVASKTSKHEEESVGTTSGGQTESQSAAKI